jgi:hypothetical protein
MAVDRHFDGLLSSMIDLAASFLTAPCMTPLHSTLREVSFRSILLIFCLKIAHRLVPTFPSRFAFASCILSLSQRQGSFNPLKPLSGVLRYADLHNLMNSGGEVDCSAPSLKGPLNVAAKYRDCLQRRAFGSLYSWLADPMRIVT